MKLKELILLEQSIADGKTAQEYKDAGYSRIAKGLINDKKKTGDVKTDVDGKSWYKATAATAATATSTTNTNTITPVKKADESKFDCIRNSRGWGSKLASKSDEPNAYSFLNDVQSEFVFFGDGKFYIQLNSGEKMFGTWKCKGQSSYEIEINNTDFNKKQYFRSETSQWADHQNAAALEENFIKKIVTKHLRSKL